MATMTTITTTTTITTDAVELSTDVEALIVKFNEAKKVAKAAKEAKESAEKAIRDLLGEATVGTINGVERVKLSKRRLTTIDSETLLKAYPEAYAAVAGETNYTVLTAS